MKKFLTLLIFIFTIFTAAHAAEVSFYGWGGDMRVNKWLETWVADQMSELHKISLRRVGMDIGDILRKLATEKSLGVEKGSIDVIWINGENFYAARRQGLLHGAFTHELENFNLHIDPNDPTNNVDFGFPVDGFEAPWGRAQLTLFARRDAAELMKGGSKALFEYAKKNPGRVTYPAPPDFTGSAFLRSLAYDLIDEKELAKLATANEIEAREIFAPLLGYLVELAPHLWYEGKNYPATFAQLSNMFADGEVDMGMSYTPYYAQGKVADKSFPPDTESFVFASGTVANTHFLSIPFNAPNLENAKALINFLLSPEAQEQKNDMKIWGDLPVIKTSANKPNAARNEFPANIIPVLDKLWREAIFF